MRFIQGMTGREVGIRLAEMEGRETPYTPAGISFIELRALKEMREYISQNGK